MICNSYTKSLWLIILSAVISTGNTATLQITEKVSHPLSQEVFGQFLERPTNGENGPEAVCDERGQLSSEIENHLAGLHAPVVRFPAGTDVDYMDWQDMIDLPGRPDRPATNIGKNQTTTNRFGFPEYFALAKKMGWSTILVTNLRDALYRKKPLAEAAAHAAALVRYATDSPVPVRISAVQVGNEGWFLWPPKAEERAALDLADEAACSKWLRECLVAYADAIHAVRPDVALIADAPRPNDGGGLENNAAAVWRAAVDHPDVRSRYRMLAAHAYAPMGLWTCERAGKKLDAATLTDDEIWNAATTTLGRFDIHGTPVADAAAYDDILALGYKTAVTEWNWNGWGFSKRFPQASFAAGVPSALGAAGFLHGLLRHPQVTLATQSMMLGTQWGITSVRVSSDGKVGYLPQAEAVRLHAEHHGNQVIQSEFSGSDIIETPVRLTDWFPQVARAAVLDAVVSADSHAYYVHLLNRHRTAAQPLDIQLPSNVSAKGAATLHLLTGTNKASTFQTANMMRTTENVPWQEHTVHLEVAPASMAVLVIPLAD